MGFGVLTIISMWGVNLEAVKSIKFHSDTGGHFIFWAGLLNFSKDPPFCLCTTSRIVTVS
jgi:hypothetical protein